MQLLLVQSMATALHCTGEHFGKGDLMIVLSWICRGNLGRGNVIIEVWPGYWEKTHVLLWHVLWDNDLQQRKSYTVKQSALGRLLFCMCSIMSNVLPSPPVGNGVWILQTWQFCELTISLNRHSQKEVVVYFNFVGSIGKLLVSSSEITLVSCALISHIIREKSRTGILDLCSLKG